MLETVLAPIIGEACWGAKKGHGSFLTFEFGLPTITAHSRAGEVIRRVYGRHHLWIYMCHWQIRADGSDVAHSESSDPEIQTAIERFNGVPLLSAQMFDGREGAFRFARDLALGIWCYQDSDTIDELWKLYGPDRVCGYRSDGCWNFEERNV
ncbi:MAG: hypothetical protein AAF674_20990 [Pseudomonadota bacterium]